MNDLNELSKQMNESAKRKGFDVANQHIGLSLMLIVSELSEALEACRKNKKAYLGTFNCRQRHRKHDIDFKNDFEELIKDSFEDKIADTMIRLFDLVGALNIDIERHIELKMKYNALRPYKHDKAY